MHNRQAGKNTLKFDTKVGQTMPGEDLDEENLCIQIFKLLTKRLVVEVDRLFGTTLSERLVRFLVILT